MISGPVGFDEILQNVIDGTGIINIRNYEERIRRLIFRAEREIGYGGSIVLKRCSFTKDQNGFNGKYMKYPDDMIELEGVGNANSGKFSTYCYIEVNNGIRFKDTQDTVVLLYWGLACDGYGNPMSTRNHEEAVVAFIIWQLYAVKRFHDRGNANTSEDYKRNWISLCLEARGDDAFPTLEEWDEIGLLSYADRRGLLQRPTASYTYCDNGMIPGECCGQSEDNNPDTMTMFYWQLDNIIDDVEDVHADFSQAYLNTKPNRPLEDFLSGYTVGYSLIGRIAFAIQRTTSQTWLITDALNNEVTQLFDTFYDEPTQTMVFVSKNYYTHSSIYFRFKDLTT